MLKSCLRLAAVLAVGVLACEVGLRFLIFSKWAPVTSLRNPGLYFNYYADEEFWELNYFTAPVSDHVYYDDPSDPLLGWGSSAFDPKTFRHYDFGDIGRRRPALLYGDSFAVCTTKKCFQHYFNEDRRFAKKCYFLNYAVGGQGIDQTYLVFHNSVGKYRKPLVIYSLMTTDLDRATVRVFVRPKPYYEIQNDRLVLKGVPVPRDARRFFQKHRPKVFSYLYLLLKRKWTGEDPLASNDAHRERVRIIGTRILEQAISELRARKTDFFFLIFSNREEFTQPVKDDWRMALIESVFRKEHVPYVRTLDLLQPLINSRGVRLQDLFESDGHPSDEQNQIVVDGLRPKLGACY